VVVVVSVVDNIGAAGNGFAADANTTKDQLCECTPISHKKWFKNHSIWHHVSFSVYHSIK